MRALRQPKLPTPATKPTRRDLIVVLTRLQNLIGRAMAAVHNDQIEDHTAAIFDPLNLAHELCIEACGYDASVAPTVGPWGNDDEPVQRPRVEVASDS